MGHRSASDGLLLFEAGKIKGVVRGRGEGSKNFQFKFPPTRLKIIKTARMPEPTGSLHSWPTIKIPRSFNESVIESVSKSRRVLESFSFSSRRWKWKFLESGASSTLRSNIVRTYEAEKMIEDKWQMNIWFGEILYLIEGQLLYWSNISMLEMCKYNAFFRIIELLRHMTGNKRNNIIDLWYSSYY